MVGTGVFTSLGFQAVGTHTGFALLALWVVGGVAALCGAAAYAELGATMPYSGGEYVYLGRIYHPLAGFLGGWISVTVGFAAPIALAAIAFGRYLAAVVPISPVLAALVVVAVIGAVHAADLRTARRLQVVLTTVELVLIAAFVMSAIVVPSRSAVSFAPSRVALHEVVSPAFAVSLIFVSYAFSGWNAAGYVAGEIKQPERVLPRAVAIATFGVTAAYVALNWAFLHTVPVGRLAGVVEVGALSVTSMFGPTGGRVMSAGIALLLLATISAMVLAGSRVTHAVVADLPSLGAKLGALTASGVPRNAVAAQVVLTVILLLTNSFERVITYAGFTLELMTLATVWGLFVLRRRGQIAPIGARAWGYPVVPSIYMVLCIWTLVFVAVNRPIEALAGVGTLAAGVVLFKCITTR
jgi:basic amino acid/polyamine antiporter, APA family